MNDKIKWALKIINEETKNTIPSPTLDNPNRVINTPEQNEENNETNNNTQAGNRLSNIVKPPTPQQTPQTAERKLIVDPWMENITQEERDFLKREDLTGKRSERGREINARANGYTAEQLRRFMYGPEKPKEGDNNDK